MIHIVHTVSDQLTALSLFTQLTRGYTKSTSYKINFWLICLTPTWNAWFKNVAAQYFLQKLTGTKTFMSNKAYHRSMGQTKYLYCRIYNNTVNLIWAPDTNIIKIFQTDRQI